MNDRPGGSRHTSESALRKCGCLMVFFGIGGLIVSLWLFRTWAMMKGMEAMGEAIGRSGGPGGPLPPSTGVSPDPPLFPISAVAAVVSLTLLLIGIVLLVESRYVDRQQAPGVASSEKARAKPPPSKRHGSQNQ